MKNIYFILLSFLFASITSAQRGPLQGSGKIVDKTFAFTNFTKIALIDLDGSALVEVGKPFSISISIDDNLENLLALSNQDNELKISLQGNRNNKMYVENTNIRVKITLPNLTYIKQAGNNSLQVNGIEGENFTIKCTDNGSAALSGNINNLTILCTGNGNVNASKLLAKNLAVTKRGNGTVTTNTNNRFFANGSGNGDIVNVGKGRADANASTQGNGQIKYATTENETEPSTVKKTNSVKVSLKNNGNSTVYLSVKYPIKGSYGIAVKPQQTADESLPIGTKLYRGKQFKEFKQPIYTVTADSVQVININK